MLTLGVDVGVTGAISCLREDGAFLDVQDLPLMSFRKARWIDAVELVKLVRKWRQGSLLSARAMVERIHAMPDMGSVACFSKGMTLGSTISGLQLAGVAIELVEPQSWKRALGLLAPGKSDREKKAASLSFARRLFPAAPLTRVGDNGRAEALLIAHYAQRLQQGQLEVA